MYKRQPRTRIFIKIPSLIDETKHLVRISQPWRAFREGILKTANSFFLLKFPEICALACYKMAKEKTEKKKAGFMN